MPKCIYCGKTYHEPYGLTLVMNDGTIKHICSSKCRKNMKMKRRKVRWISKAKKTKKEILEEIKEESKQEHASEKKEKEIKVEGEEE